MCIDARQIEIQRAELLVPYLSPLKVDIAIEKLKYDFPGTDYVLAELIRAGSET
jgi:hypothetical protein